eukprot:CAMPEP_0119322750 /NCGR_PEP_ID=MMETSP1333-20130426/59073_1 /TAXON_ID=418940 /ORGANISM="Scyphosphaera apsteinii, Strain RCC1455" /LENGTH=146 /DNA_ID=CAMNT_0007330051 /DNA_START=11 /DNA_END=451 /DNA_ORIENTATION=-
MTPLAEICRKEASVEHVPAASLLSRSVPLKTIAMASITDAELDFTAQYSLHIEKAGTLRSILVHFDTIFDLSSAGGGRTCFSTGCDKMPTHWKQTVLYLKRPRHVRSGDQVHGTIGGARAQNRRGYDISLTLCVDGESDAQLYEMH